MRIFRTTAIVAASAIALPLIAIAPARAADPVGTWLTGDKKGKVKIVNCGGAICGTLTWLAEPNDPETKQPKTDKNNKDTSKQSRPLLGVPIVLSMKPAGGDKWEGGIQLARGRVVRLRNDPDQELVNVVELAAQRVSRAVTAAGTGQLGPPGQQLLLVITQELGYLAMLISGVHH